MMKKIYKNISKIVFVPDEIKDLILDASPNLRPLLSAHIETTIGSFFNGRKDMQVYHKWLETITKSRGQKAYLDEYCKYMKSKGFDVHYSGYQKGSHCRSMNLLDLDKLGFNVQDSKMYILYEDGRLKPITKHNRANLNKHIQSLQNSQGDSVNRYLADFSMASWGKRVVSVTPAVEEFINSKKTQEEKDRLRYEWEYIKLCPVSVLSPGAKSDRLLTPSLTPYHLGNITGDLRRIILQGEEYFDLSQCHFRIISQVWDVNLDVVRDFLESDRNIWSELCIDDAEKGLFKDAFYAATNEGIWGKGLNEDQQERFMMHSVIENILQARQDIGKKVISGEFKIIHPLTRKDMLNRDGDIYENIKSALACQLQAYEQIYMMDLFEKAIKYKKNFTILSYEQDGISFSVPNDRSKESAKRIINRIINECSNNHPALIEVGMKMKGSFGTYETLETKTGESDENQKEKSKSTKIQHLHATRTKSCSKESKRAGHGRHCGEFQDAVEERSKPQLRDGVRKSICPETIFGNDAGYPEPSLRGGIGCSRKRGGSILEGSIGIIPLVTPKNNDQNENKVVSNKTATRRQCMLNEQEQKLEALRNQFKAAQKAKVEQPTCKHQERSTEPLTKSESVSDIESLEDLHEQYITDSTAKEKLWREYKTLQHQLDSFLKQHLAIPEKEIMSWALEENVKKYINIEKENLKKDDINWMYKAKDFLSKRLPNV